MKAALYAPHYIHSLHDYGISFTSKDLAPMNCFIHYSPSTDVEAYTDVIHLWLLILQLSHLTVTSVGDPK
jgi:hypothetical protein